MPAKPRHAQNKFELARARRRAAVAAVVDAETAYARSTNQEIYDLYSNVGGYDGEGDIEPAPPGAPARPRKTRKQRGLPPLPRNKRRRQPPVVTISAEVL